MGRLWDRYWGHTSSQSSDLNIKLSGSLGCEEDAERLQMDIDQLSEWAGDMTDGIKKK